MEQEEDTLTQDWMGGCRFCSYQTYASCDSSQEPDDEHGFRCTREKGHEGKHVACGNIKHALATWD